MTLSHLKFIKQQSMTIPYFTDIHSLFIRRKEWIRFYQYIKKIIIIMYYYYINIVIFYLKLWVFLLDFLVDLIWIEYFGRWRYVIGIYWIEWLFDCFIVVLGFGFWDFTSFLGRVFLWVIFGGIWLRIGFLLLGLWLLGKLEALFVAIIYLREVLFPWYCIRFFWYLEGNWI